MEQHMLCADDGVTYCPAPQSTAYKCISADVNEPLYYIFYNFESSAVLAAIVSETEGRCKSALCHLRSPISTVCGGKSHMSSPIHGREVLLQIEAVVVVYHQSYCDVVPADKCVSTRPTDGRARF